MTGRQVTQEDRAPLYINDTNMVESVCEFPYFGSVVDAPPVQVAVGDHNHVQVEYLRQLMKGKPPPVQIAMVRTSIGASWSGLHQQYVITTTTTIQITTNNGALGVANATINATCVSAHHLPLCKLP